MDSSSTKFAAIGLDLLTRTIAARGFSSAGTQTRTSVLVIFSLIVAGLSRSRLNRAFTDIACGTISADSLIIRHSHCPAQPASDPLSRQLAVLFLYLDPCGPSISKIVPSAKFRANARLLPGLGSLIDCAGRKDRTIPAARLTARGQPRMSS